MKTSATGGLLPASHGRGRVAALVVVALVGVMALGFGSSAQAADPGISKLTVRKVDSTDPAHVKVDLIYTGARADLAGMTVREGGRQVKTTNAVPLTKVGVHNAIVFAVDSSRSMGTNGGVKQAQESMRTVVSNMQTGDEFGLVTFGTKVRVLTELTADRTQAMAAIDELSAPPTGSTALFDGVRKSALLFSQSPTLQPNLVLVTDGFDDSSVGDHPGALAQSALVSSGAALFALKFDQQGQVDDDAISKLVAKAGGGVFVAPKTKDLAAAFDQVQKGLTSQFQVEFASAGAQGATALEVAVGGERAVRSFVPGSVAQGSSALDPPTSSGSPLPAIFTSGTGKLMAMGAIFLAVALGAWSIGSLMSKNESVLDNALNPYVDGWTPEGDDESSGFAQTALFQRAVEFTGDFAEKQGVLEKVEKKLEQANLPLRAAEAMFFYAAGVLIFGILMLALKGLVVGLIFAVIGAVIPRALLNFLAKRRQKQFNSQLPDTLQLLSGSLRAGYSLMQGVEAVSQEVQEPMGKELRRVCTEARLGRELEESLDGVGERMDSADFEWAVMAIRIQREVGGNLAELLQTVGETMVDRERMRREVAALTAEGKISAIVLGILPPALGLVMYVVNPGYMEVLFTETVGKGLLAAGVVSTLIGFAWMKKVITIEI